MTDARPDLPVRPLPPSWSRLRLGLWLVGGACVAYGAVSAVVGLGSSLLGWLVFVAAGVLLHDGVITPLVAVVGRAVGLVHAGARAVVASGLVVTGLVLAVVWSFVLRLGESADLPSFLPRNYTVGLLVTVVAVWLGVLALVVVRRLVRSRAVASPRATTRDD